MRYVYIFKAGQDHYKVGITNNITKRVSAIQTSNSHKIYVVTAKLCENAGRIEKELHSYVKAMKTGGGTEWFKLEPEDVLRLCIVLHAQPEIDVFVNVDLNTQLTEQRLRHKSLEKKLDKIVNSLQTRRPIIEVSDDKKDIRMEIDMTPRERREQEESTMLGRAAAVVQAEGKASTSLLQRRLQLGYGRAARVIEQLEEQGIIGPADGSRPRKVLNRQK